MSAPIPFGSEFQVNTTILGDQQSPAIAHFADGRFVAVWADWSRTGEDTSGAAVRGQIFSATGQKLGDEFLVNTTTENNQNAPSVMVLSDGRFVVAWQDLSQTGGDPDQWAIRAQIFNADTTKAGGEFLVNTTTANSQYNPIIAALDNGRFVIAWEDHSRAVYSDPMIRPASDVRAQIFGADGTMIGGEIVVNSTDVGFQTAPRITTLLNGNFVAIWMDSGSPRHDDPLDDDAPEGGIRAQIFGPDGARIGADFLVKSSGDDFVQEPALTSLPNGGFAVAWVVFTHPDFDDDWDNWDQDGDRNGDGTPVAPQSMMYQFTLHAQIFTPDGTPAGPEVWLNPDSDGWPSSPSITALSDGKMVITWVDTPMMGESNVRAQMLSPTGELNGPNFQVNTGADTWPNTPRVAPLPDGKFVVGWSDRTETGPDDSGSGVRAQIFDASALAAEVTSVRIFSTRDVVEGNGGTTPMPFVVERFGNMTEAVTISWTAEGWGSFPVDAADIVGGIPQSGTVTIAAGQSNATITLQVIGDTVIEPIETVRVTLTDAQTASGRPVTISNAQGFGRILDDDTPPPPPPPPGEWGRTWGDPHLVTLDGLGYSFQAVGEFVLLESVSGDPLNVQIRTIPLTELVSVISAVATRMGDARVMIDGSRDVKLLIDGVPTTVTAAGGPVDVGGGQIFFNNETWTLVQPNGEQLQINLMEDGFLNVAVAVADSRSPGSLRGLLGNNDGVTGNDLALRDGTILTQPVSFADLYGIFADSWRITEAEALFHRAPGETTADHQDPSYPRGQLSASDLPPDLYAAALAAVTAAGITDPMLRDAAILDFALTGQFGFINAAGSGQTTPTEVVVPVNAPPTPGMLAITAPGAQAEGNEGSATPFTFVLSRLGDASSALDVGYTLGGDIDADDIIGPLSGTVSFAAGQTERMLTIMVRGDDLPEMDERLTVTLDVAPDAGVLFANRSATTIILNDDGPIAVPPTGAVLITGIAEQGSALRADVSTIADVNGLGTFSYQWFADGVAIDGADSDSFTPGAAQIGRAITVQVSYIDGIGTAESLTSQPSAVIRPAPMTGTDGNDWMFGTTGPDTLLGRGGDDRLFGDGFHAAYDLDLGRAVYRLYQATLDRAPDAAGQSGWTQQLASGANTLTGVATGFVNSPEFQSIYGPLDNEAFVRLLYQNVLNRAPDDAGLAGWVAVLEGGQSRAEVVLGFSQSQEFIGNTNVAATEFTAANNPAIWQDDVFRLYQATLDREPDLAGLKGWTASLANGTSFLDIVAGFVNSPEFQNTYGDLDNDAFVTLLYQNVLNRAPDDAGLAGWTELMAGGMSRPEVVRGFSQSPEFVTATAPALKTWIRAQGVDDVLDGGAGTNDLWGGMLTDVFRFQQADGGTHRVQDLEAWDFLDFRGFGFGSAAEATARMTQQGADVVFADQGTTVVLMNTQLANLEADMFLFA